MKITRISYPSELDYLDDLPRDLQMISPARIVILAGPNGSGKTRLLNRIYAANGSSFLHKPEKNWKSKAVSNLVATATASIPKNGKASKEALINSWAGKGTAEQRLEATLEINDGGISKTISAATLGIEFDHTRDDFTASIGLFYATNISEVPFGGRKSRSYHKQKSEHIK